MTWKLTASSLEAEVSDILHAGLQSRLRKEVVKSHEDFSLADLGDCLGRASHYAVRSSCRRSSKRTKSQGYLAGVIGKGLCAPAHWRTGERQHEIGHGGSGAGQVSRQTQH